jgi:hypothetical protein
MRQRLISAGFGAETDRDAIPSVDGCYRQRDIVCVGPRAEHPIGDAEEPWSVSVEYIRRRVHGLDNSVGRVAHIIKTGGEDGL